MDQPATDQVAGATLVFPGGGLRRFLCVCGARPGAPSQVRGPAPDITGWPPQRAGHDPGHVAGRRIPAAKAP